MSDPNHPEVSSDDNLVPEGMSPFEVGGQKINIFTEWVGIPLGEIRQQVEEQIGAITDDKPVNEEFTKGNMLKAISAFLDSKSKTIDDTHKYGVLMAVASELRARQETSLEITDNKGKDTETVELDEAAGMLENGELDGDTKTIVTEAMLTHHVQQQAADTEALRMIMGKGSVSDLPPDAEQFFLDLAGSIGQRQKVIQVLGDSLDNLPIVPSDIVARLVVAKRFQEHRGRHIVLGPGFTGINREELLDSSVKLRTKMQTMEDYRAYMAGKVAPNRIQPEEKPKKSALDSLKKWAKI